MHRRCLAAAVLAGFVLGWLTIASPVRATAAPTQPDRPRQMHVPAGSTCEEGTQSSGARYRICLPDTWNGGLVVYAHGYVAPNRPVEIPEDQMSLGNGVRIDDFVTAQGFAFATSSYRANGLVVRVAQEDLVDAVGIFVAKHGQPNLTLLAGVSEGGLITAMLAESRPDVFRGALALCGPYGDFGRQVNYLGDARVLFDYYFPGLMPPTPVDIPDDLLATWETTTYSTTVKPVVTDPANAAALEEYLTVGQIAYDAAVPASQESSVERVLWYNVYATDNATAVLGGQPFDNAARAYSGSGNDAALNAGVQRFSAQPAATAEIAQHYQTSGKLQMPLVLMHTTGDPIVPVWHLDLYKARIAAAGASPWSLDFRIDRYGHCAFEPIEVLGAFNRLVALAQQPPQLKLYLAHVGKDF